MKFGLIVPNILSPIKSPASLRSAARLAEEVGFDSIWVSDHVLATQEMTRYADGTEALMTLAYLAGVTQHIPLGTSVLVLPMRNPLVAAKQIATMTYLAERATIIGVGVGWSEGEFAFLNADFHRRGKLIDEYIAIMRKLWTEENPSHEGTYTFSNAIFSPRLNPIPPIWIGGGSDAAIKRAAMIGDGFQPGMSNTPEQYAEMIQKLREVAGSRRVVASMSMKFDMSQGSQAVIDSLSSYVNGGLEYPVLRLADDTLGSYLNQIEAFAREVMPAFA